jgi:hypothetical protein
VTVVRVSKGRFDAANAREAEGLLTASEVALREPLEQLNGLLHYYVGIDRDQGFLTNVSVWRPWRTPTRWTPCQRCSHNVRSSKVLA